jgi:phosphoglycolate phosphatase
MSTGKSLALFDIDGTLMRGAGPHHKLALTDGIRRATGRTVSIDGIDTAGSLDRDLIGLMLQNSGYSSRRIRDALRLIMRECETSYRESCPPDLSPFLCAGVKGTLDELRARGVVLGIVSGNLTGIGWKKMEAAGLREYFSVGAFAEDGRSRARLAKVAFWRACRQKFVRRNSRVSLIGDHRNDVTAAKRNGFQSIAVASGVLSPEELAAEEPDILIRHLGELDVARIAG